MESTDVVNWRRVRVELEYGKLKLDLKKINEKVLIEGFQPFRKASKALLLFKRNIKCHQTHHLRRNLMKSSTHFFLQERLRLHKKFQKCQAILLMVQNQHKLNQYHKQSRHHRPMTISWINLFLFGRRKQHFNNI